MKPILQNLLLDKILLEKGYVVVSFLNEEEVDSLKAHYFEKHRSTLDGMYATAHISDLEFRMEMNNAIKQKFNRAIDLYFYNANPLGGSFIAKGKGSSGILNPHQDWNIVDERLFRSFNIWVPLVDLNENNGAIRIIPESHLWNTTYRSVNTVFAYQNQMNSIIQQLIPMYLKAGEALIYDHRLIHASGENHTKEIRLAAVYGIIPEDADMYYYHQKDNDTIEVYESDANFFLYGNIFEGPKGLKKSNDIKISKPNPKWLTISIPAYNDSQSIVKLVNESYEVCNSLNIDFDILIVNDGSSDNTLEVIKKLADQFSNITIYNHEKNLGFGSTLKDVFTIPKTDWVLFLPGDNQFPASNLNKLMEYKIDHDFILGKRKIRRDNLLRILYAGFYNHLVSFLSGYYVEDVNGIIFYKTALLDKIKFTSKTSFVHAEFFIEAKNKGYKVIEIPIEHKEREFGKGSGGKWSVIVPIVIELFNYIAKKKLDGLFSRKV